MLIDIVWIRIKTELKEKCKEAYYKTWEDK